MRVCVLFFSTRLKAVFNIGAALALMVGAQAWAAELTPNVFSIALKSLQAPETTSLSQFHNKSLVVSFFEPDCPWCYRQILMLNDVQQRCSDQLQVILIGTQGTRQQLQNELRRSKTLLPAFASSSALLQLTGPIRATPVTFIFNGQGVKVAELKGFAPQSAILDGICRAQVVP